MYDIIGDVHGHFRHLKRLLKEMGYVKGENGYTHPERKAVFIGDFINRGPEIRKTIRLIRKMVDNGSAHAILGNHELNAIIFNLKDKNGLPLVKKPNKYFISLFKTLNEFSAYPEEWNDHLLWMRSLPLFIDLGEIRVVHACWSEQAIERVNSYREEGQFKKKVFRKIHKNQSNGIAADFWLLTKGVNMKIPSDLRIVNNKGVSTRSIRIRWWEEWEGKTFEDLSFESKCKFPGYTVPPEIIPEMFPYNGDQPILFLGHYCRGKGPFIVKRNICCVDSCVTGSGVLTAYRWSGEKQLLEENLVNVKM